MAVSDERSAATTAPPPPERSPDEPSGIDESVKGSPGGAERPKTPPRGTSSVGWITSAAYVGGLLVLYVGERVLGTLENANVRWAVSGLGAFSVLCATAVRFVTWRADGERGRIERLLGVLSLIGLGALVLYLGTTEWGLARLGLAEAETQVRERVTGPLTIAWVSLLLVSLVPMLFAEVALYPMRSAERLESRRVQAAAVSGTALAVTAISGALLVFSASHAEAQADFSYFKTSEPSESTRKLLEGLREPIQVTAFFPEVSPARTEVDTYLRKLGQATPNLKWGFADRYLEPKLARDLNVVQDGVIVVQKGEAKRTIPIGTELNDARQKLRTLDRDFHHRVLKLLRQTRSVYLTVGHGELNDEDQDAPSDDGRRARILKELLSKQNYFVRDLGLLKGLATDVPNEADIVMILGPTQPFSPEEVRALERYVKRGGSLFIALDPDAVSVHDSALAAGGAELRAQTAGGSEPAPTSTGPAASITAVAGASASADTPAASPLENGKAHGGLHTLASLVGLEFVPTILANDKQYVRRRYNDSDRTLLITNRFSSHASVSTLSRNSQRAAVLVSGAGSLEKATGSTVKADIAIRAMSTTFNDENRNYRLDASTEKLDSFALAYAVTQPIARDAATAPAPDTSAPQEKDVGKSDPSAPPDEMRAFVVADADAFSDMVLKNFMANQLFLVDAVRWLGGEESFAGEATTEEDVRIEHTQQKDLVWFYATIFGAPTLVLGVGLLVNRRPRRRGN